VPADSRKLELRKRNRLGQASLVAGRRRPPDSTEEGGRKTSKLELLAFREDNFRYRAETGGLRSLMAH